MKATLLKALILFVAIILTSCGGGKCASCTSTPTGVAVLSVVAPNQFPAHQANIAYLTVRNTSTFAAIGLIYSIGTNNTGGTISIVTSSATTCANIAGNDSCLLQVSIAANANPGSFTVLVSAPNSATLTSIKQEIGLKAVVQTLAANIGLLDLPANTASGANAITLLSPSTVRANPNGATQVIVTAVVNSSTAGAFNTINLTTENGTLLNFSVLSGNSGSGLSNLSQGSVVSFMLMIPAGASQLAIYLQTAENGSVVSQGTVQNLIQLASTNVGILSILPTNTSLTANYASQIFTLLNTGAAAISNLNIMLSSSALTSSNACGSSLAAGSSCSYTVNFDAEQVVSSSANITANYNNGQTNSSAIAHINYTGINPVAGLTISSGSNPNFNFATTTIASSQSMQITIKNTGNTNNKNITFTVPQYFSLSSSNSASCTLSGESAISDTLAPSQSCNLTLSYSNSSATNGTLTSDFITNYIYDSRVMGTPVSVALTYSTTQAQAVVGLTPSNYTFPNTLADNSSKNTASFTLTNSGDNSATNLSLGITGTNAALFTIMNSNLASDCSNFGTLAANQSCLVTVQVGPTATVIASASASLNVNYVAYAGQSSLIDSSALTATTIAPAMPNVAVQSISMSPVATSGSGAFSPNQWQILQNTSSQTMTITYINTGNKDADNFTVDTSRLSSGYTLSSNSCSSNFRLAANSGSACQVVLSINTATLGEEDLFLSNLTSTWVGQSTPLASAWINPSSSTSQTSVYLNVYSSTPIYGTAVLSVNPSSLFISATATATITVTGANAYVGSQTFTITSDSVNAEVSPSTCSISNPSALTNSCSVTINATSVGGATISAVNANYTISPLAISIVADRASLSPPVIVNDQIMTYTNNYGIAKRITSITSNNSNVVVAVNGNFCTNQLIANASSCNFVLSATNLSVVTNVQLTVNYADGSSSVFNVEASNSALARFNTTNVRYLLIRYIWASGDFDIAAGFGNLSPSLTGFPLFTSLPSNNCVGFSCFTDGSHFQVIYGSEVLISWAGDNTRGGEEDVLVDLWLLPTGTTAFNYAVWGNWYVSLGSPTTVTIAFETFANGTTFNKGSNKNFIPSTNYLTQASSLTNVTWYGSGYPGAKPLSALGLICNYSVAVISGQANNATCQFSGI